MFAKKSLGQHFLTSQGAIMRMVEAGKVRCDDVVVEIGPGKGVLTRALLDEKASVVAIEKDAEMIPILKERFEAEIIDKKLILIEDDVRNIDILWKNYKVVANIPYYITGELFEFFLSHKNQPNTLVFLVQKEVAERITKDPKESLLSMSIKVYGDPLYKGTVKAGSFAPKPKVDSAIIAIENISRDFFKEIDEKDFFTLLKAGFSHKRKTLKKNLCALYEEEVVQSAFSKCEILETIRAENLTKENWQCLSRSLLK